MDRRMDYYITEGENNFLHPQRSVMHYVQNWENSVKISRIMQVKWQQLAWMCAATSDWQLSTLAAATVDSARLYSSDIAIAGFYARLTAAAKFALMLPFRWIPEFTFRMSNTASKVTAQWIWPLGLWTPASLVWEISAPSKIFRGNNALLCGYFASAWLFLSVVNQLRRFREIIYRVVGL